MAGYLDSKPCFVVSNVTGAYVTNRVVANAGELFTAAIDAGDNIYVGGYNGSIGSENKYIVKYSPTMTKLFGKNYGSGNIRYMITDGNDIAATGFDQKPCVLKIDATGNILWYKEYTINGKNADAYMIHKEGASYYIAGNFDEGGNAKSFVMSVDPATGNVNWCKTYVGGSFSPHFTGMAVSPTGISLCGATAASNGGNPGNLIVAKIDFTGNIIWTRQINGQFSWYMRNPTQMGNSWGISCAIDPYGALVVAGETDNNYSMMVKMNENTGSVIWTKRYGNGGGAGASDDGFHGITVSGCTYLASGWMGAAVGSGWDFGLVVTDTSGFAGASAQCGTVITKTNSSPAITVANGTVTTVNLTTNTNFAGTNTTANMSRTAICSGSSSYSISAITNTLCSGGASTLSVTSGALSYSWTGSNPGTIVGSNTTSSIVVNPSTTTSYSCFVGGTTGCVAMLAITVSVSPGGGPTVTVSNGTISCSNTTTTLNATGGGTYSWSGPGIMSGGATATPVVNQAGTYSVTVSSGGCSTTTTAIVSSIGSLTLSIASQTNVNCFGASTGSASTNVTGGTGPYSYTWTPGNLSGSIQTGLAANIYTINVKDANQCVGTTTLTISQPTAALAASISATTTTGCGASTGGATVTANGGTSAYSYSWSPSGGTTAGVSNLASGNNTVLVTDAKGCTITAVANITSANGPTLSITSQTNVLCFGSNTGAANTNVTGGTGPYTYTWSPGNLSGANQTGLAANIYTINITDVNQCAGSTTLSITQPTAALSTLISNTTATGCGANTGGATVTANGGTSGYTYSWSPSGGTTAGVSNLATGNNTVLVTDANGCTVTAVTNITSAGSPTLSISSQTNVNCFGASTGSASANVTGGTGPYTYTWMPGNLNGANQTGLAANIYTINVSDANQCSNTITLSITQPTSALAASITATTTTGCGASTGGATVTVSGGTAGYTYNWSPSGGTTAGVSNLASGNNTVLVTDANSCTITAIANITSSSGPTLTVASQTNVACFGANTGSASLNASGGTGPYTYTWMPGNLNGPSQSSLSAGTYTINVADASQCTSSTTLTISQPTAGITGIITNTPTGCTTSVGGATVTANGGTPGYTYSWGPTPGSSNSISGLAAGSYSVIITDSQGCTQTVSTTISTSGTGPTLSIASQTNISCVSGSAGGASINASGNGPFNYTWTPNGGNSANATGLNAGLYNVSVSDAAGCVSTISLSITQPVPMTVAITNTAASCGGYDGAAEATVTGGSGTISYLWNINTNNTSSSISGLSTGTYSVLVTDAAGCTAIGITNISSVGTLTVDLGGDKTILEGQNVQIHTNIPSGSSVEWTPSTALSCTNCPNPVASPTVTTQYCAFTTVGTCTNISCLTVEVKIDCASNSDYSTPNAFTPNDDGVNDQFCLKGWKKCINTFYIAIYNRWGEKVYDSDDADFCWDGKFRGILLNNGVFVFYIKATLDDGSNIERKGNINLIR